MSLESRIRALETLLDPGADKQVEQEHQARMRFVLLLCVQSSFGNLPEAWRLAFDQALQALDALPSLPKHQCAPKRPLTDNEREFLRWLERPRVGRLTPRPALRAIHLDKETLDLWARFAPHVPIPGQQEEARGELDVPMP